MEWESVERKRGGVKEYGVRVVWGAVREIEW
jgi:hypothetical protein